MSQNPAFDSSIPVLTEVVLDPLPLAPEPEGKPDAAPVAATPSATPMPPAAEAAPDGERDWDALELRIAERVLAQLQPQIDAVVRNAFASAADQIHIGVRQAVEQMVAQQVAALQFKGQ